MCRALWPYAARSDARVFRGAGCRGEARVWLSAPRVGEIQPPLAEHRGRSWLRFKCDDTDCEMGKETLAFLLPRYQNRVMATPSLSGSAARLARQFYTAQVTGGIVGEVPFACRASGHCGTDTVKRRTTSSSRARHRGAPKDTVAQQGRGVVLVSQATRTQQD